MAIEYIPESFTKDLYIKRTNKNFRFLDGRYKKDDVTREEVTAIISAGALDTKMLVDVGLGNAVGDYTDWTHVKSYDAYSIWKIAVSTYAHNAINQVYLDGGPLLYMGQAASVSLSAFDSVQFYDGSSYTNNTTEAASEEGTPFTVLAGTDDFTYIGDAATFGKIDFAFSQWGANVTLKVEYSQGSSVWQQLVATTDSLVDNTNNMASDGLVTYNVPGDWATDTVNGVTTKYWIRVSTTTAPTTDPKSYYLTPGDSAYSLLSLSNRQMRTEAWAWCYYNNEIYVTIPNTGYSAYEGRQYITSASSSANKQNFFVYNHQYTSDYEDSSHAPRSTTPNTETLTGTKTLTVTDARMQFLDPGGAGRKVLLPAEASSSGLDFMIFNTADASEDLTVKEDSDTTTIVTISQNEGGLPACNGTTWKGFVGGIT